MYRRNGIILFVKAIFMGTCGYVFLDTSALVKRYVKEEGSERLEEFLSHEAFPFTSPFCFYEALNVFKRKRFSKHKDDQITQKQYEAASITLIGWFGFITKQLNDIDFTEITVALEVSDLAKKYNLDFSDAFQILCIKKGFGSNLINGSQTIHVTADDRLGEVAKLEGIKSWHIIRDNSFPNRD